MKKIFVLAALLVAILSSAAAQWKYLENVDALTDEVSHYAYVQSTDGARSLVIRLTGDQFEVFVAWHEYMIVDEEHTVLVRFDSGEVEELRAIRSTDKKASFLAPGAAVSRLSSGPARVIVRITETSGVSTTAVFDTSGVKEAVSKLLVK